MANVSRARGFLPTRHLDGSPFNGQHEMFLIPAADGTITNPGDVLVTAGGSGVAGLVVAGQDCEGMPFAKRGATGTVGQNIVGVCIGFLPDPTTNLGVTNYYRTASTNRVALVVTDLTVLYEVEEDAVTTPIPSTAIGLNASYTTTAGSTVTGNSGMKIVSSTVANTATFPFKLIGLVKRPDNAFNTGGAATDPGKFLVMLNASHFATNVVGQP